MSRVLSFACVATLLAVSTTRADEPSAAAKSALGPKGIAILQKPTKVEAFRINPKPTDKKGDGYILGYAITSRAKELPKDFAGKVAKVLLGEKAYAGDSAKCFQPGVAFRVWKDKEAVDVVICFRCTNFEVRLMGEEKAEDDTELHGFGPGLEPFLALAKEAFPDDNEVQGLK